MKKGTKEHREFVETLKALEVVSRLAQKAVEIHTERIGTKPENGMSEDEYDKYQHNWVKMSRITLDWCLHQRLRMQGEI